MCMLTIQHFLHTTQERERQLRQQLRWYRFWFCVYAAFEQQVLILSAKPRSSEFSAWAEKLFQHCLFLLLRSKCAQLEQLHFWYSTVLIRVTSPSLTNKTKKQRGIRCLFYKKGGRRDSDLTLLHEGTVSWSSAAVIGRTWVLYFLYMLSTLRYLKWAYRIFPKKKRLTYISLQHWNTFKLRLWALPAKKL